MSEAKKPKKTLADILKINQFKMTKGRSFRKFAEYALINQYGEIGDHILYQDFIKHDLRCSVDLCDEFWNYHRRKISLTLKKKPTDLSRDEIMEHISSVRKSIEDSNIEGLLRVSDQVRANLEKNSPSDYYDAALNAYNSLAYEIDRYSTNFLALTQKLKKRFKSSDVIEFKDLDKDVSSAVLSYVFNLPRTQHMHLIRQDSITKSDIEDIRLYILDMDKKRNELHKHILSYAEEHFQKDYLDVYLNMMEKKTISRAGPIYFTYPNKDSLFLIIGMVKMSGGSSEFYIPLGTKDLGFLKKRCESILEELTRRNNQGFYKPNYKSLIQEGRTEDEDTVVMDSIESRFKEYVTYKGYFVNDNAHGTTIILKLIEFDMQKIRQEQEKPTVLLEKMGEYVKSLLPEPPKEKF
jgi:hypothetical protein